MSVRRLFIAGARCPGCGLEDKLQLCTEADKEWVECVRCGYTDVRPTTVPAPPPATEAPAAETTPVQVVRFKP